MKINVIVVPERKDFIEDTSHRNVIYINKNNGIPKLAEHNAKYVAPLWLDEKNKGVNRVYHIIKISESEDCTILELGNSFLLSKVWLGMGNNRKFEYHGLEKFNFVEIKEGILMNYNF